MTASYDVVAIVGSLRRESFTRRLVRSFMGVAPAALKIEIVEIRDLQLYDQDLEAAPPAAWASFRARVKRADAVLFATPEYNRSVPGLLKNAIDVGSRPYGQSAWSGKPAAVVSVSPGALGAFGANHHLRQSLVFLDMPTMQQPEAYIGHADKLFDDAGEFINPGTREFAQKFLAAFAAWIERQKRAVPQG
ncbi:MAG TPA: NAD(P)H-dependent oxidoreductase [Steroidobacteraceae bacterium]|jgi:chromate reductase|nr:NAD(P)H-dependent oxidoreductase [Steroidobacteraceae bacterium]